MERDPKSEYGLLIARMIFYFVFSAAISWFFTDYYISKYPTLLPSLSLIQTKSFLEIGIYSLLFLIILVPYIHGQIVHKHKTSQFYESFVACQELLTKIALIHTSNKDINTSLNSILEEIGTNLLLDRVYLYKLNPNSNSINITNQWVAEDVTPLSKTQVLDVSQYPIFTSWLESKEPTRINDTANLEDENIRLLMSSRNSKSLLISSIELFSNDKLLLVLDSSKIRSWTTSDSNFIQSVCVAITGVIERHDSTKLIGEISSTKAHFLETLQNQLKVPINASNQNIESLVKEIPGTLNNTQKELLSLVKETNTSITNRISEMFTILDCESGKLLLSKEEFNIVDLVEKEYNKMLDLSLLKEQKTTFIKPISHSNLKCYADKAKVSQAIWALLENASHYTHRYGGIEVRVEVIQNSFQISVQDQGIGIALPDQDKVFTPFFRAKNAKSIKPVSSGVGLYIAKSFIDAHGGTIGFSSKEDEGSLFWISLPKVI